MLGAALMSGSHLLVSWDRLRLMPPHRMICKNASKQIVLPHSLLSNMLRLLWVNGLPRDTILMRALKMRNMVALSLSAVWLVLMAVSSFLCVYHRPSWAHAEHKGCWGPCYTMSSHAALGVVRAGVAVLKGKPIIFQQLACPADGSFPGTGVRINCISPGQIDIGVDLKDIDIKGMTSQLPPASLQSKEVSCLADSDLLSLLAQMSDHRHRRSTLASSAQDCLPKLLALLAFWQAASVAI